MVNLLVLEKGSYSSFHWHRGKSDKFTVIKGEVKIVTELRETTLKDGDSLIVDPPLKHQFEVVTDSVMVEISYARLDPEDINRLNQGGKIIEGKKVCLDKMIKSFEPEPNDVD
jgi:quercetin dioxygenase-like cupin family protein